MYKINLLLLYFKTLQFKNFLSHEIEKNLEHFCCFNYDVFIDSKIGATQRDLHPLPHSQVATKAPARSACRRFLRVRESGCGPLG